MKPEPVKTIDEIREEQLQKLVMQMVIASFQTTPEG